MLRIQPLKKSIYIFSTLYAAAVTCVFAIGPTYASSEKERSYLEYIADGYTGEYINSNGLKNIGSTVNSFHGDGDPGFIYNDPNVRALGHLYWNIGYYDIKDNNAIADLVRINDCDLYQKYSANEFEWSEIINATRSYIINNKDDFSTRFEFILPLSIETYEEENHVMVLQKGSQLESKRIFALAASDALHEYCDEKGNFRYGVPRGLIVELSRPLTLTEFKVVPEKAKEYMDAINAQFRQYSTIAQTRELMLELRKAFLFLRLKVYTYDPILTRQPDRQFTYVKTLATLEGFSIYADITRKLLLHNQNYVSDSDISNAIIQDQIETQLHALIKKANDKGTFH